MSSGAITAVTPPPARCRPKACEGASLDLMISRSPAKSRRMVLCTLPPMADATLQDEIIDADVKTIADLPFHIMGRFPKPLALGRCRGDEVIGLSSKEMLRAHPRSVARPPRAWRIAAAIASPSSPRAGPNGCCAIWRFLPPAPSRCRFIRRCRRHRPATSSRTPARGSPIVSTRLQLEKMQEVRHLLPALEAVVVMDAPRGRRTRIAVGPVARRRRATRARPDDGRVGSRRVISRRCARGHAGRPRDDHLHVGHDR